MEFKRTVGDRVLTDVVFGNQYGMLSVLVEPLSLVKDHPVAVIIRYWTLLYSILSVKFQNCE